MSIQPTILTLLTLDVTLWSYKTQELRSYKTQELFQRQLNVWNMDVGWTLKRRCPTIYKTLFNVGSTYHVNDIETRNGLWNISHKTLFQRAIFKLWTSDGH